MKYSRVFVRLCFTASFTLVTSNSRVKYNCYMKMVYLKLMSIKNSGLTLWNSVESNCLIVFTLCKVSSPY